ncbi:MAG TPA: hypothetical protein VLT51_12890, partial [Anaerolineales bacterium]|nr:hypothetical protein [Anaerolineales bacterium]
MLTKNQKRVGLRMAIVLSLIAGVIGVMPVRADVETADESKEAIYLQTSGCQPGSGWMWTNGPLEPSIAAQVQQELNRKGIEAIVTARSYGETDSCGTYSHHGVDFTITLSDAASTNQPSQQTLVDNILPVLVGFGKPNLGNVNLVSAQGDLIPINVPDEQLGPQALNTTAGALSVTGVTKRVYVIVYDPLLSNGQKLSEYMHWNDHSVITQQTIDFFTQYSNNKVNYTIADTTVVTSGWPELIDGFSYTETEYLAVWSNPSLHHEPTTVNYNKIVNSPEFDICGRLNRGEIDEVWIYNGPWFGFYESTLVGPDAYYMNSNPVNGPHECNKILPIMGPSVERTVHEAVHNFTHRTEDTMKKVYGS